jgi:hypothetical protein
MPASWIQQGAIGKVIQTINIAPHQIVQGHGDAGGGTGRPEWFWNPDQYGGILCDIGSHQVDQFLFYTGSKQAEVVESQIANVRHPDHPALPGFRRHGAARRSRPRLRAARLVHARWPGNLGRWPPLHSRHRWLHRSAQVHQCCRQHQGNNLFIVDNKQARYIDCNNMPLPFGPQFVADIVNRTHVAQDQDQCLLAAELVIKAQNEREGRNPEGLTRGGATMNENQAQR